mgnify:CR=1 FL=1
MNKQMSKQEINGYVYPQVQVITIPGVDDIANVFVELYTEVRKQDTDGEWYLLPVRMKQMMSYPSMTVEEIHHLYAKFMIEVYKVIKTGVIDEKTHKKDEDTRTEEERINDNFVPKAPNKEIEDGNKEAV